MGALSEAKVEYSALYTSEVELNDVFNKFVTNFQLVYQGPNTARAQIGAKFNTSKICVPLLLQRYISNDIAKL